MSMSTEALNTDPLPPVAQTDWFLQKLVSMTHNSGIEFGITLQVSGMLVSGSLVGGDKYFDGFGADFSEPFIYDAEVAESIKSSFKKYGDRYLKDEEGEEVPPPQFIHLKDAHFFNTAGNPIPGNKGVWWRGRISEVGGFSLGILSMNVS